MSIFDKILGKKDKNSCGCGDKVSPILEKKSCCSGGSCCDSSSPSSSRFIVLGACCKKSSDTFENTKIAVKELGFEDEVVNIGDMAEIAKYGVMSTPALVVDGKVLSYGKLLKVEDVKSLIKNNI